MRTNNISVEQFIQEVNKRDVTGVICTRSFTDSFHLSNVACLKEDGCIRLTNKARVLLIELDVLLNIERIPCNNGIVEYEINTMTSTITLDVFSKEGE